MGDFIKRELEGTTVLIPVLGKHGVSVTYNREDCCVYAKIGNKSYKVAESIDESSSGKVVNDFVDDYLAHVKAGNSGPDPKEDDARYFSTWWVFIICLILVFISTRFFSGGGNDKTNIENLPSPQELVTSTAAGGNAISQSPAPVEQFNLDGDMVEEIMKTPDEAVIAVKEAKAKYMVALKEMQGMSQKERAAYIQRPDMQKLINTQWVEMVRPE